MGKNVKCPEFLWWLQLLKRQRLKFLPRWWFITPRSAVRSRPRYQQLFFSFKEVIRLCHLRPFLFCRDFAEDEKVFGEIRCSGRSQPLNGISNLGSVTPRPWEPTPMFLTSDAIEKQLSWQPTTIRRGLLEMLNSLQVSCLKRALDCLQKEGQFNVMD